MNENQIKKPIGIIGAMDEEVSLLKESASARLAETVAGMEFSTGELGDTPVVIVKCGIGKVNAGICTQILISRFQPAAIINTGVAGSLNADIDIGDIVVSTEAVQHDFNVSEIGVARGEIPPTGRVAFPADSSLCRMATEAVHQVSPEIHVFEGRICSGDQFISSRSQKDAIIQAFGGLCCEMEGAAIAQVCYLNETPFVILRAISDKADESSEVSFAEFCETSPHRCAAIVKAMISSME